MNIFTKISLATLFLTPSLWAQPALPCGHSHNDYLQERPLYEAVELGYGSIEIDICLTDKKELKVAHVPWFLGGKKEVEELYFAPIAKMIEEKSPVFRYSTEYPLNLLIDFKKNADSTYKYLKNVFTKYARYITQYGMNGQVIHRGPLVINLTGNKPWAAMAKDTLLYARMDGPLLLSDTNAIDTTYLRMTGRVAANYQELVAFKKQCKTEEEFYSRVKANIGWYNRHHLTARYYAVPNKAENWEELVRCGLNWINVDKLKEFSDFYHAYSTQH